MLTDRIFLKTNFLFPSHKINDMLRDKSDPITDLWHFGVPQRQLRCMGVVGGVRREGSAPNFRRLHVRILFSPLSLPEKRIVWWAAYSSTHPGLEHSIGCAGRVHTARNRANQAIEFPPFDCKATNGRGNVRETERNPSRWGGNAKERADVERCVWSVGVW